MTLYISNNINYYTMFNIFTHFLAFNEHMVKDHHRSSGNLYNMDIHVLDYKCQYHWSVTTESNFHPISNVSDLDKPHTALVSGFKCLPSFKLSNIGLIQTYNIQDTQIPLTKIVIHTFTSYKPFYEICWQATYQIHFQHNSPYACHFVIFIISFVSLIQIRSNWTKQRKSQL